MELLSRLNVHANHSGASTGTWWSTDKTQPVITSENPSNQKEIACVHSASFDDYETIITASQKTFCTWRKMPAPKRGEIIREIGDALRLHKADLGMLVSLEMGKSLQEGLGEVQEMIDMADFSVGQARMLYGKTMHSERPEHRMYEQWHALGVVGVITAFNFPVAVWAWNAFIAAIAGNTVIWKPSPKTPLCALAVQKICHTVLAKHQLEGVFSLFITADNKLTNHFVEDPRVALISFTGSSAVGKIISEKVSQRFGKYLLELSGNNAIIVDETANLDLAVPAIVFGAVGTAGQRCTTTRRLIVHHSIKDRLTQALIKAYQGLKIGDPLNEKNHLGPLIDASAVKQFENAIQEITRAGGEILQGGNVIKGEGYFVEPTLVRAENHWEIVQRETFAPILYILSYETLDQAIQFNNAVPQGLSSSLFTQNLQHAEHFLSICGSDCGIANINIGTSGAEIGGAFGGEKATGGGREAGSDAWKAYMRRQTNTINWGSTLPLAQGIRFEIN